MSDRNLKRLVLKKAKKTSRAGLWSPLIRISTTCMEKAPPGVKECWRSDVYSVQVYYRTTAWGTFLLLTVRRHDAATIHKWHDLMRIKDEIAGPERIAFEMYPARSELVDNANLYHLWVVPEGVDFPIGMKELLPG